jgi:hypothetical protein
MLNYHGLSLICNKLFNMSEDLENISLMKYANGVAGTFKECLKME